MATKEMAQAWFGSIDRNDMEALRTLMAPNHAFHSPMTPAPIGADEHIGIVQQMKASWEGTHHTDQVLEDGDHVIVRGHWSGKHVGEFNGVPATGKEVEFSYVDIFEVVDGKVGNEYFEMDMMGLMGQIGALETTNA